jgi:hypothetical protein
VINKYLKVCANSMLLLGSLIVTSLTQAHSPPQHARVYFVDLDDGAVMASPFKVKFGIEGFGITPAATTGKGRHTAGHHHLLVDMKELPSMNDEIPRNHYCRHFDDGETEAILDLPPGQHTLQLLLGDESHEPQDPPLLSEKITITVK